MRIYVNYKLRCLQMLRNIKRKYSIVGILVLLERKFKSTLIALPYLTSLSEHWTQFLLDKLLRVLLSLFSQLVFVHFFVHLLPCLFGVACFHLVFLFICHELLGLATFLFFNLSLF